MKTRKQWFQAAKELGLPWADQALTNLQTYLDVPAETRGFDLTDKPDCKNLSSAVESSFEWHATPEGHDFWEQIWRSLCTMNTEPSPHHIPTALDYHTAESLHSFLDLSGLILQPYSFLHWKRVTHRPTTSLRGQPHQGLGVPELTNGVLTYWRRLSDNTLILVSAFNVQPAPRLPLSFLNHITKKSPAPRTPRPSSHKPLLLADFV